MRIGLVKAESYSPLDLLKTWKKIASASGGYVPAAFDYQHFLMALFDDDHREAFHILLEAQLKGDGHDGVETPIDFTADTNGEMWGLSFSHEKGEKKIFATTITLLCIVPQHQPPMREVCANQLWIDIADDIELEKEKIFGRFGPAPQSAAVTQADKLLKLFNTNLLENDKAWEARRFTHDGWIEVAGIAMQPFVQPLIELIGGKLNQ